MVLYDVMQPGMDCITFFIARRSTLLYSLNLARFDKLNIGAAV